MSSSYYFIDSLETEPKIYSGSLDSIPDGFNAVLITLNGRMDGDLKWKREVETALKYAEKGYKLFWEIDLGLFSDLKLPLSDESQFAALQFSLNYFKTEVWEKFKENTLAISLYKGKLDSDFIKRDQALEYITLLRGVLPGNLPSCILLEIAHLNDPLFLTQFLNREAFFPHIRVITPKNSSFLSCGFISPKLSEENQSILSKLALCIGSSYLHELKSVIDFIQSKKIPFKIIPEETLVMEWENLDELIVLSKEVHTQYLRKLQGFCAAGGRVVSIGKKLGLPLEIQYEEWQDAKKRE